MIARTMQTATADENDSASALRFGVADLHLHTDAGDGMSSARDVLDRVERATELDVIAITDHDDIAGALAAREVHTRGEYHFAFVPGIEVTTRAGHLLALWVDEPIASLRPLDETIAAIHRAGGMAVIPHPFSYLTRSVGQRALERLLRDGDAETRPDGIEVANPSLAGRVTRAKAQRLNRERYRIAEIGGSDAHFIEEVGVARTLFGGTTSADLRASIEQGATRGLIRDPVPLQAIGARRLLRQQVRGLSVTPRKVLARPLRRLAGALRGGRR